MGWSKVCDLEHEEDTGNKDVCQLWSRRGLDGVEVVFQNHRIKIPKSVLLGLVADHRRNAQVS